MIPFSLLVFFVSTVVHLYASFIKNQRLRNFTKPFILLSLLVFYCFSAEPVSIMIAVALFLSWLGDVFFIPTGMPWFVAGGISFMVSHLFFILGYSESIDVASIPIYFFFLFSIIFTSAVILVFRNLKQHLPKALAFPIFFYLLMNGAMNCFALLRMISCTNLGSVVTCIGALLFFISDSIIFFVRFNKNGRVQSHFMVMLTYSLGEFLIILGLVF